MADNDLFRKEVFDAKANSWLGEVVLIRPLSFHLIVIVVAVITTGALAYLVWGEYTKKAKASGYVIPNDGVIKLAPQSGGLLTELRVKEGQQVEQGQVVGTINTERTTANGEAQAEIMKQLTARRSSFLQDKEKISALYDQQQKAAADRRANLTSELAQLDRNLQIQRKRLTISESILATQRRLHSEKFISDLALQQREQESLTEQSTMETLNRAKTSLQRDLAAIVSEEKALPIRRANELAALDRSLSGLEQDKIEVESRREIQITAPQAGTITAIATDVGKIVQAGQPILSVIPKGASMQADLYIAARSAGFIREGSRTLLQYQAFPYQKFGTHEGTITRIARVAVPASELPFPAAQGELYYVARVQLAKQTVTAYGSEVPLQAGMLIDANILLDRRTLFEWVFEPLFSISGRWGS